MLRNLAYASGVALAYYISGRLALFLAIPPGYATAVWPAAGVALVAILLYGYRVWPGILIGHFLVNLSTGYDASTAQTAFASLALPLVIAGGGTLQSVVGAAWIKRAIGSPIMLEDEREIATFLALGGPASCVISPTIGQLSLIAFGKLTGPEIPFSWFTWWVGDTVGVLVVAPLLLAWLASPRDRWRSRRVPLTGTTAVALTLAVVLYVYISGREQQRIRTEFERTADALSREFTGAVRRHLEAVTALGDLYASVRQMDRAGFATFARALLKRHAGVQALEWAPVVTDGQRDALERTVRGEGFTGFAITDRTAQGQMVAAARRASYVPVLFMEPYRGNEVAFGVDVAALPGRKEALDRARDSGRAAASGRLTLVQERADQAGILVVLPVYDGGASPPTVDRRRSALRGYMLGVYRIGDLVEASLLSQELAQIDVAVTDDMVPPDEQVLYERGGHASSLPWRRLATTDVGDHQWSIRLSPGSQYLATHRNWQGWIVLVVGLLFASLLEMLVLLLTGRAAAIQRVVEQRTAQLRDALKEKETLLQEIHHRVKNNLQVVSSLINMQMRKLGPSASAQGLQECQMRVQAIALIHEKLYQSRDYSRVPFSQYAGGLAAQVFHAAGVSPGAVRLEVEVGEVELPVDKAIPCGLILNELITNALKHAFPQDRSGTLRVELDQAADGRVRLAVKDDGVGFPAGADSQSSQTLGLQLVHTLATQLAAKLEVHRTDPGTSFEVVFRP